jgi:hypothetical protein
MRGILGVSVSPAGNTNKTKTDNHHKSARHSALTIMPNSTANVDQV